jgi:hypothetical protein
MINSVLKAALVIGDSESLRSALREEQRRIYSNTISIPAHCPTRFGVVHMICVALKASKEAVRALLEREDWDQLSAGSVNARSVATALGNVEFWRKLDWVIDLNSPVVAAISKMEADQPHLSRVLGMWKGLIEHARVWGQGKPAQLGQQVLQLFERRFQKHYSDSMAAAYVVDPTHWGVSTVAGVTMLQLPELTDGERAGVIKVVQRLSGGSEEAVQAEYAGMDVADWPSGVLATAKVLLAGNPPMGRRRGLWIRAANVYPLFAAAAMRLLSCHASSCAAERNWSAWGRTYDSLRNKLSMEKAEQLIFLKANMPKEEGEE